MVPVHIIVAPWISDDLRRCWNCDSFGQLIHLFRLKLSLSSRHDIELSNSRGLIILSRVLPSSGLEAKAKILFLPTPSDLSHRVPPFRTTAAASTVASSRIPYPKSSMRIIGFRLRRI